MIRVPHRIAHVLIITCISALYSTNRGDEIEAVSLALGNAEARVRFVETNKREFDVVFEVADGDRWVHAAEYPTGQAWTIYSDWRDSWHADPHHIGVQRVEPLQDGRVQASASALIDGHRWQFSDTFSLAAGMIKVERVFAHLSEHRQGKVTLETRIRIPLASEPNVLIPGSIYNGNPSSTLPGPRLSMTPGAVGLYEEHRLPIPMVNVESTVAGRRLYGTLITKPSKIVGGNKGDDHWWSMGVEVGDTTVDLVSISGPVATNGRRSTVYGHRNGFDPYDEAYLNVHGQQQFKKTLFLDVGKTQRQGYSFRSGLWKAFELFQPVEVPHVEFNDAMALKVRYAKGTFFRAAPDVAGFCAWPWPNRHFQYGWCGGNIAIAYGLLAHGRQSGDKQAIQQAVEVISFYAKHAQQDVPGMLYGDYFAVPTPVSPFGKHAEGLGWQPTQFHGVAPAISSRQMGETLERLAEAIVLARKMHLESEAANWLKTLRRGCDFLARSPRSENMFPRAWNVDGTARGWDGSRPQDPSWLSAAGAYCIGPLVRMSQLSGDKKYLALAEESLIGYWEQFGKDQSVPPWGGTHDAGAEDKEAGWGLMKAALDVHQATGNPRYLKWAQLAADWTLTWMYFHDVGMPNSDLLREHMDTTGWTFISTQNQEIDVFGNWMAPDYYRLGQLLNDDRYKQIGKVLFDAATQTIARDGAMFGQAALGIQAEHYNHTNCTYVLGAPWRGSQHSVGISWVLASSLYGGAKLAELDEDQFSWFDKDDPRTVVPTSQHVAATWRYTHKRPAKDWTHTDFDDTSWVKGPGGFGEYGTPDSVIATWWDTAQKQLWMRRSFALEKRPKDPRLVVHHDDATEIFINGVLAAKLDGYQTRYRTVPLCAKAAASLRPGKNVLAVTCQDEGGGRYIDVGLIDVAPPTYNAVQRNIVVDGNTDDWQGVDHPYDLRCGSDIGGVAGWFDRIDLHGIR